MYDSSECPCPLDRGSQPGWRIPLLTPSDLAYATQAKLDWIPNDGKADRAQPTFLFFCSFSNSRTASLHIPASTCAAQRDSCFTLIASSPAVSATPQPLIPFARDRADATISIRRQAGLGGGRSGQRAETECRHIRPASSEADIRIAAQRASPRAIGSGQGIRSHWRDGREGFGEKKGPVRTDSERVRAGSCFAPDR